MTTGEVALLAAAAALLIAVPVAVFAAPLGTHLGLLDFPDTAGGRKRHARITPMVGGIALAAAAVAACLLTAQWLAVGPWVAHHLVWLAGVTAAMFLIGFADDRFALGPVIRLILTITTMILALVDAPDFAVQFLRFTGQATVWPAGGWGEGFALLCLVGLLNAVNMADGKDGVILSMGLIWTAALAMRLPSPLWPLLAALATVLAVLLVANLRGRLFMGDGGSYALSALFGLLAIYAYNHDFAVLRAEDVATLFAIPVFDTIRLMTVRVLARRSPFEGDRDHLHHHLHARFGWPAGLIVYVMLVAVPNLGAVLWPGTGVGWLLLSLALYALTLRLTRFAALPSPRS